MSGNWKMYKTPAETTAFFEKFRPLVEKSSHCEIVICPPFTNLAAAAAAVKGSNIRIGAQNIGWAKEGAFTGEIRLLAGTPYVASGHILRQSRLLALDVLSGLRGGPVGLAGLAFVVGPSGPVGPGKLAETPRKYAAIAGRNVFKSKPAARTWIWKSVSK